MLLISFISGCTKSELDSEAADKITPTVVSVIPGNESNSVPTSSTMTVTFSEKMDTSTINNSTITLKNGTLEINGTVTCTESTATFKPAEELEGNTVYTMTVKTGVKDIAGNEISSEYIWTFMTAAGIGTLADVIAPTVSSVLPVVNGTAVQTNIKPSVTFSELMNNATINASTVLLKQGSTSITGAVSISGNTATFSPANALAGNTLYSVTVTTGVKDAAGNPMSSAYTWSFTTGSLADLTAPTVTSVVPSANATGVTTTIKPAVTFSEPMNNATITTSTLTVRQGNTSVPGSITFSGNTATFTPANALAGNTLYTISVTTGVKDASGNPMASVYTWTFTTVSTAPVAKSFAVDVVPVLNLCNTCHTHGWNPSSTPSTFHANLVSEGYINLTTPTSGKIYNKLSGGHPPSTVTAAQKATVLTWIQEGSKNN